jgi:hypothetical protein
MANSWPGKETGRLFETPYCRDFSNLQISINLGSLIEAISVIKCMRTEE